MPNFTRQSTDRASAAPLPSVTVRDVDMYGLRVRTAVDLPEWPDATPGEPDVIIDEDPPVPAIPDRPIYRGNSTVEDSNVQLEVYGVGRYSAVKGSHVRVTPEAGARPEDVRLYLTGLILGVILHQRGMLALHASCVVIDGTAVAFACPSGGGKSTLAAALLRRGATFVSDDICVLTRGEMGETLVWAGPARLKLDARGLSELNHATDEYELAGGDRGKYHLPVEEDMPVRRGAVPISRVYQLAFHEGEPRIERLTGVEAISVLVDETYLVAFAAGRKRSHEIFLKTAAVSGSLTVGRLFRPRGFEHLDSIVDLIERDVRSARAQTGNPQ